MKKINKKQKKVVPQKIQDSIGTRIAKAVYAAKKISERIFGYISYDIKFVKATYTGKTQRPAKITALEKGIVGILLVDETASFEKIGTILGLDVINDRAEQAILRTAIATLQSFNAIEGDDSCMALTDDGRAYAEKGERPDSYTKSFDIFVDTEHPSWLNIKNCLGDNIKDIDEINTPCDNPNFDLEQIRAYAECQAQDVHYPRNRYILESVIWNEGHEATYKVYVCFVQNVATGEVRTFVYDEKQNGLNELIAEQINKDEDLKTELLSNCIRLECENNEETEVLEGQAVEAAIAEIPTELKEAEQQMIQEEKEAELARNNEGKEEQVVTVHKPLNKDRLHKKALYDSLSFEVELQKIFKEDNPDEIWLISPWIRKKAFIQDRGPMIEDFLSNENKRVFIAYSEPADNNDGKPMVDIEVEPGIKQLEEQYSNFYYVQLPEFHLKNVIEVKGDQTILFSGSFNVLSFSVSEQQTHVRREEMALAHHSVAKKKYLDCQFEFAKIYAERIRKQVTTLNDSDISTYKNEKLEYFLNINDPNIHKLFLPIEELLEEKSLINAKRGLRQKLDKVNQELVVAANMSGINPKDKKRIEALLLGIENDMKNNNIEDPSMMELLNDNKERLSKIHERKIFQNQYNKKYVKNNNIIAQTNVTENKEIQIDILKNIPETTEDKLALYIATLSLSFINREIKKTILNAKLSKIIDDDRLVSMLEMVSIVNSRTVENAFDLLLGINGYLFRFPKLFNNKENFVAKQKKANRFLKQVNQNNIESIVKQLS